MFYPVLFADVETSVEFVTASDFNFTAKLYCEATSSSFLELEEALVMQAPNNGAQLFAFSLKYYDAIDEVQNNEVVL